jgi:hypothetical protein
MSDTILTLPRMARRLGVTAAWLRDEADGGRVPCLPAGKRYLFEPVAVERAIADRAAKSTNRADNKDCDGGGHQ